MVSFEEKSRKTHQSIPRNPLIANALFLIRYIEPRGKIEALKLMINEKEKMTVKKYTEFIRAGQYS
jgi:predicted HTH transcriptional regulator